MTAYFAHCTTSDEIKTRYRELAKQYHPDIAGVDSTPIMQAINAEYAYCVGRATRAERPNMSAEEYADMDILNEAIRKMIDQLLQVPGIDLEICGWWIWVSGDTRPVKDRLKEMGLHWAPKKEKWYWPGVPSSGRGEYSMEDIRSRYGSQRVRRDDDERQPRRAAPGLMGAA